MKGNSTSIFLPKYINGFKKIVKKFTERGLQINELDIDGESLLHVTTNVEFSKFLINNGADNKIKQQRAKPRRICEYKPTPKDIGHQLIVYVNNNSRKNILNNNKSIKVYLSLRIPEHAPNTPYFSSKTFSQTKKGAQATEMDKIDTIVGGHFAKVTDFIIK